MGESKNNLLKDKTIAQQVAAMKHSYPQFTTRFVGHSGMSVHGEIMPTARSEVYRFEVTYNLSGPPKTKVISPQLRNNFKDDAIPHIYTSEKLCLYRPKYFEFRRSDLLTDTIIPWTALWLYFYEIWHVTGNWLGGGEHLNSLKA